MLDGLKRLFSRTPASSPAGWEAVKAWADHRRFGFRPMRDGAGFIVEGQTGTMPWRLEWGPSQRPYVQGAELRIRAEAGSMGDMQAMVLDRALQVEMERSVFEQFVEGVQTRIDNQTPPEMRWLVLYSKLEGVELGALREGFSAVGASKPWMMAWLDGALSASLLDAPLVAGQPMVLMLSRGRITLRTGMPEPSTALLDPWLQVFQVAVHEARRVADEGGDASIPSTQPSLWSTSQSPEDPPVQS